MPIKEIEVFDYPDKLRKEPLMRGLRELQEKAPIDETVLEEITEIVTSSNRKDFLKNPLKVFMMTVDAFGGDKLAYSKLASDEPVLEMSRDEFLSELMLYIEWAHKDNLTDNPFIYGINVIKPSDVLMRVDPKKFGIEFPDTVLPLISSGNISHHVLHRYPAEQVSSLLREILSYAAEIDISFRPTSAGYSSHKLVRVS